MTDQYEPFKFQGMKGLGEEYFVEPNLNPEQQGLLREMGQEGGPLWEIQKSLLDYMGFLKDNLARVNLNDPNELKIAREISAEIKAVDWQHRMWERLLTVKRPSKEDTQ